MDVFHYAPPIHGIQNAEMQKKKKKFFFFFLMSLLLYGMAVMICCLAFQLFIGPDDFGVMMGVLNENLPEGEEERNAAAVAQAEEAAAAAPQAHKSQSKTGKFFVTL